MHTLVCALGLGTWVSQTAGKGVLWMKQLGQDRRLLSRHSELRPRFTFL